MKLKKGFAKKLLPATLRITKGMQDSAVRTALRGQKSAYAWGSFAVSEKEDLVKKALSDLKSLESLFPRTCARERAS